MANVWTWIKAHSLWLFAAALGLIAAYYLIFRPSSSAGGGATTISYPATTGGGGVGGGGGVDSGAVTPTAPYSPDFSILGAIADGVLRGLWERALNLQVQINAATLSGNTALVNSLETALGAIMRQIEAYAATPGGGAPPTLPKDFAAAIVQASRAWAAKLTGDSSSNAWSRISVEQIRAWYREYFGGWGIPAQYSDYVMTRIHNYIIGTGGLDPSTDMIVLWLREAYSGMETPPWLPYNPQGARPAPSATPISTPGPAPKPGPPTT